MNRMLPLALVLAGLAACSAEPPPSPSVSPAPAPPAVPKPVDALDAILAGDHRSEANRARDEWRHPKETLAFCRVEADQRVVEITPGGGWYTEILAPWLRERGSYVAAIVDPETAASERAREYYGRSNQQFRDKLAADPDRYGEAEVVPFTMAEARFGDEDSADRVLTFRNVHNWVGSGATASMFNGFYAVLQPGGMLCVVEHRARADDPRPIEELHKTGYVPEAWVIEQAIAAGFALVAQSEVNANPADDADHPNGVWTLAPTLNLKDIPESEHEAYRAIGESDRMTLLFVKPEVP